MKKHYLFVVVRISCTGARSPDITDAGSDHDSVAAPFRADESIGVEVHGPFVPGVRPRVKYFPPAPIEELY